MTLRFSYFAVLVALANAQSSDDGHYFLNHAPYTPYSSNGPACQNILDGAGVGDEALGGETFRAVNLFYCPDVDEDQCSYYDGCDLCDVWEEGGGELFYHQYRMYDDYQFSELEEEVQLNDISTGGEVECVRADDF